MPFKIYFIVIIALVVLTRNIYQIIDGIYFHSYPRKRNYKVLKNETKIQNDDNYLNIE